LQRDVVVQGLRLRYIDVPPATPGSDATPLLLVHGHTSRIEEYDDIVPILSEHRRVLVVDLPGSGYSDKPDRPYSLRFYEDSLLGFLDVLGVRRAHLGGGSLGGNLTLRLGLREPERFVKLAAWAPAGAWRPLRWAARLSRVLAGRLLFWPVVWGQSRYWYESGWEGRPRAIAETFAHYREVMSRGFIRMYWEIAIDQIEQSLFDSAPSIRQPTLLAWGDRDHGLNLGEGIRALHKMLPRSELHVFHGARHALATEVPGPLAHLVDDFLARPS
jgi:triacylglycerol lipase